MATRVLLGNTNDFPVGKLREVSVEGKTIMVAQVAEGQYCAVRNKCPHLGLPFNGGKLEDNKITCPWHNSQFDMCSGKNLDWVKGVMGVRMPGWSRGLISMGKDPEPVKSYAVTEEDGQLYMEM